MVVVVVGAIVVVGGLVITTVFGTIWVVVVVTDTSFSDFVPVTSGVTIATLTARATSITGFEYFSFKSILLDRG